MKRFINLTIALMILANLACHSQGSWKEYREEVNTGIIKGGNIMTCFTEASDGSIWVSNTTGSVIRMQPDEITIFDDLKRSIAAQTNIGVIANANERTVGVFWESAADIESGWVWFVSNRGIALWDGNAFLQARDRTDEQGRLILFDETLGKDYIIKDGKTIELPQSAGKVKDPLINMYSVMVDSRQVTWFGGFKGRLFSMEDGQWNIHEDLENYDREGLNEHGKTINKIFEDSRGTIWLVSSGMVSRFRDGKLVAEEELPPLSGANHITEGTDGTIWVSTRTGPFSYNGTDWKYHGNDPVFDKIYFSGNIQPDSKGNIWFLTTTNAMYNKPAYLYMYDGVKWEKHQVGKKSILMDMIVDRDDRIWVCDIRGVYLRNNGAWELMRDCGFMYSFNTLFQDSQGRIWVGRGSFKGQIDLYTEN